MTRSTSTILQKVEPVLPERNVLDLLRRTHACDAADVALGLEPLQFEA